MSAHNATVAGPQRPQPVDWQPKNLPSSSGHLDLSLIDICYTTRTAETEYPIIHLFGKPSSGGIEHIEVHGFRPYFYIAQDEVDVARTEPELFRIEPDHHSIDGDPLARVFTSVPRKITSIRDHFTHYEADIYFPNRFLIDKGITSGVRVPCQRLADGTIRVTHDQIQPIKETAVPRVQTLQIKFGDLPEHGVESESSKPVEAIAAHDSTLETTIIWSCQYTDSDFNQSSAHEIRRFESEEALAADYLSFLDETDPSVLAGWKISKTVSQLITRLKNLNKKSAEDVHPDRLSRLNEIWESDYWEPDIKGRILFDIYSGYNQLQDTELDTTDILELGHSEFGIPTAFESETLTELAHNDNLESTTKAGLSLYYALQFTREPSLIRFWNFVRQFVGCRLEDTTSAGSIVDIYVLQSACGKFVLPSNNQSEPGNGFRGGDVFEAHSGIIENVGVLDIRSMYPMIMDTLNASPETRVDPNNHAGETYQAPNGVHFRKDTDGLLRSMVRNLLKERDRLKENRDAHEQQSLAYRKFDRQQAAVKVIMNALYGTSGWSRFRLYRPAISEAITESGRELIRFTKQEIERQGYDVPYGDTDGCFVSLGSSLSIDECVEQAFSLAEHVNREYDSFMAELVGAKTHRIEIEVEKIYRRFFQPGKQKRYAGLIQWTNGEKTDQLEIKGLRCRHSDAAPITKNLQRTVVEKIVRGRDVEEVVQSIRETIQGVYDREIPVSALAIPTRIRSELGEYQSPPEHVKGAMLANSLLDTSFGKGDTPKRLAISSVDQRYWQRIESERDISPFDNPVYASFKEHPDVICFESVDQLPEEFRIDREQMIDRTIKRPLKNILSTLNVSWSHVEPSVDQEFVDL